MVGGSANVSTGATRGTVAPGLFMPHTAAWVRLLTRNFRGKPLICTFTVASVIRLPSSRRSMITR